MAPAGKQKQDTQGPAPAPPLLECSLSRDVDLTPVLPWTAAESSEHGRTLIWPGAIAKQPVSKAGGNLLLKAGKMENFRYRWVLMSHKDANPRLEVLKGLTEKTSAWSSAKLSDPRAVPILERFSCDISAKRLTGGMIVKEFMAQRLAPLQSHSRPRWD
ncbi:hypothetical protein D1007_62413 [Hordeum vulgare]|nr:hypothetical protein D1007_62413 [Hordeum vulgare]